MMRQRAVIAAAVLATAAAVACSSSSSASHPTSSAVSRPADVHALAAKIRSGLTGLTSAHIAVDAGALGGSSSGDFEYANGTATASHVFLGSGQPVEVITVDSASYVKLPASENTSGKPWLKVSRDSSNQYVRGTAGALSVASAAGSIPAVAGVVDSAASAEDNGTATVDGVPTHRYLIDVVPAQAPEGPLGSLLRQLGQQTVPVQVDLDDRGRPVRITVEVRLGALTNQVTIAVSRFDVPVHIAAPPVSEIGSG